MAIQGHGIIQTFPDLQRKGAGSHAEQPVNTPGCGLMSCTHAAVHHEDVGAAEVPSSILLSLVLNLLSSLLKC